VYLKETYRNALHLKLLTIVIALVLLPTNQFFAQNLEFLEELEIQYEESKVQGEKIWLGAILCIEYSTSQMEESQHYLNEIERQVKSPEDQLLIKLCQYYHSLSRREEFELSTVD